MLSRGTMLLPGAAALRADDTYEEGTSIGSHLSQRPHHRMYEREDATDHARQGRGNSAPVREYTMLLQVWLYVFLRIFRVRGGNVGARAGKAYRWAMSGRSGVYEHAV